MSAVGSAGIEVRSSASPEHFRCLRRSHRPIHRSPILTVVFRKPFAKVSPQLQGRHSILIYRPERLVYAELIFDESGRLATLLLLQQQVPQQEGLRTGFRRQLRFLVNEDTGCRLPTTMGRPST